MHKDQLSLIKKVLHRIAPHWPGLLVSLLLASVYVVMNLSIPILVGLAIDCILEAGNVNFTEMGIHLRNVALCAAVGALSQEKSGMMFFGISKSFL